MNTKRFWMALSALAVLAGCARISESEVNAPEPEGKGEVIIHATLENGDATKTVLQDNGTVLWNPGDQIAVFFNTVKVPFTSYNKVDAASAYFVGNTMITTGSNEGAQGGAGDDYTYWGVYPYKVASYSDMTGHYNGHYSEQGFYISHNPQYEYFEIYGNDVTGGSRLPEDYYDSAEYYNYVLSPVSSDASKVGTYLFNWQRGCENSFDPKLNIAVAKSDDYKELAFYNVLGGVRFSVSASDITRVVFRGNNNEDLAGYLVIEMGADGKPKVQAIRNGDKEIVVSLEKDQPFKPGVWYYAMMVPTTLPQGYTMEVYTPTTMAKKVVTSSTEIKRSVFGSLDKVDAGLDFSNPVVHPKNNNFYVFATQTFGEYGTYTWNVNNNSAPFGGYGITLLPGDTCSLSFYEDSESQTPLSTTFPVQYLIKDPTIVTIGADNVVKGLKAGITTVLVRVDDLYMSFSVNVQDAGGIYDFNLEADSRDLFVGDTQQVRVVTFPANASVKPTWYCENERNASVDENGVVTALAEGWAYIRARIGDRERSIEFRIRSASEKPVEGTSDWSVFGRFERYNIDWTRDFVAADLGDGIYVVKNLYFRWGDAFKWRYKKDWEVNRGVDYNWRDNWQPNKGFAVVQDGDNIYVESDGYFDVYYNANLEQVAICYPNMEPVWDDGSVVIIDESPWSAIGSLSAYDMSWDSDIIAYYLGDGIHLVKGLRLNVSDEFKLRKYRSWDENRGGYFEQMNEGFPVYQNGVNIKPALEGVFDVYYNEYYEQIAICDPGKDPQWTVDAGAIQIDGDFSDWNQLDLNWVSQFYGDEDQIHPALQAVKVFATPEKIYVYIKWDTSLTYYAPGEDHVPFHCFINTDGDTSTGGFADMFSDACSDIVTEGWLYDENGMCSYDPAVFPWVEEPNGFGWGWGESILDEGNGLGSGAGVAGEYEFSLDRIVLARAGFPVADVFSIGFDIEAFWESVGVLPEYIPSEDNPSGKAPSLWVSTYR